ncbi:MULTISPECIES: glycosyltransferase family 2 protein [unclassified Paracoccus (in: a-proteobacteria)]|uniref:glycosyltransferase family 2 protein n=1 Tax=unclassified Paracoccus (in: a-proteobacteria) TaxID=2688777 RepID=UPI0012B3A9F1|nr:MULTISPECIES: glycosyltransferase family 2 protein [unclassified Paracoccus (in: a-proteobacteria)]UXU75287.1 glycosyltransferase family 2 protein [Paracoccus sp. SMMA_5]UXU81189.1 glycosyltransferase family 2 protein [Paracoccus sp. SMMA_5_TC]
MNAPANPDRRGQARDWALCVATYNRGAMLLNCVRHALASTLPPSEIVIIDASDDWQANRDAVAALVAQAGSCPLHYQPARRRSLTAQRNQAVALASADILFMIDDDAMLAPATAQRIMDHYRADTAGRIVALSCCPVAEDTAAPDAEIGAQARKQVNRAGRLVQQQPAAMRRLTDFALRHLLMIPADQRFVGYDSPARRWQGDDRLPAPLARVDFIVGFALTLRRWVAQAEPFDEGLVGSCMAEDLDASYRFGRHGLLGFAPDAPIRHLEAAAGRDRRRINSTLALLNVAYFVRRNSDRPRRDLARYALWYLRMTLAELPKDLAGGRWRLPQLRGALDAGRHLPALLRQTRADLPGWYQTIQTRLVSGPGRNSPQPETNAPRIGANGQNFPEAKP